MIDDPVAISKKLTSVFKNGGDFARFLEVRDGLSALKIMTSNDADGLTDIAIRALYSVRCDDRNSVEISQEYVK